VEVLVVERHESVQVKVKWDLEGRREHKAKVGVLEYIVEMRWIDAGAGCRPV
jgi:hypothetical protein